MGFWGNIRKAFSPQNYRGGSNVQITPWLGGTRYDYVAEAGDLWTNSAVSICLKRKAAMKSELVLRLGQWNAKEQKYVRVEGPQADQALAPFNRPNGYYTWSSLQEAIQLSYDCRGHAFVYKNRDEQGRVVGLYYLPHYAVRIETDSSEQLVTGYKYMVPGGGERFIAFADVLMIRQGIDPRDMRCGLSPLQAEAREIAADNSAANRMGALLVNGMDGTIVSPKAQTDNATPLDALRQIMDKLNQAVRDRLGMASFVPVPVDIGRYGYSPKDFEFAKIRAIPTDRICAAMGADPMAFGLPSESKIYNNLEQALDALGRNAILPEAKSWAEQMSYSMLPEFRLDPSIYRYYFDKSEVTWLADETDQLHDRNREDFMAGIIDLFTAQSQIGLKPEAASKGVTYFDLQAKSRGPAVPSDAQKKSLRDDTLRMGAANVDRLTKAGRVPGSVVTKRVTSAAAQAQHDKYVKRMESDFASAFSKYKAGTFNADELQEALNQSIYDIHRAQYKLGYQTAGGTPTDELLDAYAQIAVDGQQQFLLNFIGDVQDGRYDKDGELNLDGALKTRSNLYAYNSSGSASFGFVEGSPDDSEFDWNTTSGESCEDCIYLSELGPYVKETVFATPRSGDTVCLGECECELVRSDGRVGFSSPR